MKLIKMEDVVLEVVFSGLFDKLQCKKVTDCLLSIPIVEAKEVIHAKWERQAKGNPGHIYTDLLWHCSNCGFSSMDVNIDKYFYYCPNCGAKMDNSKSLFEKMEDEFGKDWDIPKQNKEQTDGNNNQHN